MLKHAYLSITTTIRIANKYKDTRSICDCLIAEKKNEINNDAELKKAKEEVIRLASYEANYESNPQSILQAYTLWKRPIKCYDVSVGDLGKYRS